MKNLYKLQAELDELIAKKYGHIDFEFNKKLIALFVELGEFANETRCFKYWSQNQRMTSKAKEEFVDVLHFTLSIANNLRIQRENFVVTEGTYSFDYVYDLFSILSCYIETRNTEVFIDFMDCLISYGCKLWTMDEIKRAYVEKNEINRMRLANGY